MEIPLSIASKLMCILMAVSIDVFDFVQFFRSLYVSIYQGTATNCNQDIGSCGLDYHNGTQATSKPGINSRSALSNRIFLGIDQQATD
jgi:hypothetical protein